MCHVLRQAALACPWKSLAGVDLLSLDGRHAVRCLDGAVPFTEVRRFPRVARWLYKVWASLIDGASHGIDEIADSGRILPLWGHCGNLEALCQEGLCTFTHLDLAGRLPIAHW